MVVRRTVSMGSKPRKKPTTLKLWCAKPDRHAPKLKCGYPLPCPHHTLVITEEDLFGSPRCPDCNCVLDHVSGNGEHTVGCPRFPL